MSNELPPAYTPTQRFTDQNGLYGNHFRFILDRLPDLTFFCQAAAIPTVSSASVNRGTPFTPIREVGDTLDYASFQVNYQVDTAFKTYYSLYWWMKGYGFPHSWDEAEQFRVEQARRTASPRPLVRELEKTNAVLQILQPDTETIIAEVRYTDVIPVALAELRFAATDGDAPQLFALATFVCTDFDIIPGR